MAKLSTFIVSGSASGNWSVNVDAASPEDAKAQVEAIIDEFEDAPADLETITDVSISYVQNVGPAILRATDPIHPTDTDRDPGFTAALRDAATIAR